MHMDAPGEETTMGLSATKTVRELALEVPNAIRVFERFGIDYCCGGTKSLEEACVREKLLVDEVIYNLEHEAQQTDEPVCTREVESGPLADLVQHIQSKHHVFTRQETARIEALLEKVCSVHGKNHPELLFIRTTFQALSRELSLHLMKEERILFPYIIRMEEAVIQKERPLPPPFGSVQNPVHMMTQEHDSAGEALRTLREASAGYSLPADACLTYRTLYDALQGLESDLHQHIHLENNVLFPRAIAMEAGN